MFPVLETTAGQWEERVGKAKAVHFFGGLTKYVAQQCFYQMF